MTLVLHGTNGITFPAGGTANVAGVAVGTTDVQTLTNKTMTMGGLLNLGSTGQIQFPATANPSSNANTLDDYEEGTWSPTVGGNATYTVQAGSYTKIGRLVHLNFDLRVNVLGTGSSRYITGLPFPHTYNGSARNAGSVNWFTGLAVSGTAFYLEIDSNGIYLGYTTAAAGTISEPNWIGNGSSVMGSVWYATSV